MVDGDFGDGGKQKKGRKPFAATDAQRDHVRRLVGDGAGAEAIARAVCISEPTLRKHFALELGDKLGASDNLFSAADEPAPPAAVAPARADRRGKGGGRPVYVKPYSANERVMQMVAVGMPEDVIALALGCSVPVYRRAYRQQIATGRQVKQAEVVDHLFRASKKGSVPAQTRLLDMIERARLSDMDRRITGQADDQANTKSEKPSRAAAPRAETSALGKKLQARAEANEAARTGPFAHLLGLMPDTKPDTAH